MPAQDEPTQLIREEKISAFKLELKPKARDILRRLAGEVAALANRPQEKEKRELWQRHNSLEKTRPVIFCDPENSWNEIVTADRLICENSLFREWEKHLRRQIFWGAQMGDDYPVEPFFNIGYIHSEPDWGLKAQQIGGGKGNAYSWDSPVKTEADLAKFHFPQMKIDFEATQQIFAFATDLFGDLLHVRMKSSWWWSLGMTAQLVSLRGLEQTLFDMTDNPALLHRLMRMLSDGTLAMLDQLEAKNLLSLNCDGTYVGSGGIGWTDELPQPDFSGKVRLRDMWGFCESQETVGVSQKMFDEFVLQYQLPILRRFGLNCYGCCEPIDSRWDAVKQIPNLRRISVSPWSDLARMADLLTDQYIYSMKPNPADLSMDSFDETGIRKNLREALSITRDCCVEVIMKDNHTIRNDPQRVIRWVQIALEETERVFS